MTAEEFRAQFAPRLPHQPGVYRYLDEEQRILYVGKAKDLFKRVSSYFNKNNISGKTALMLRKASRIEFTVLNSERDALLLENSLIKEYQPRFNVSLKDDKTYPWICISGERFPRVFLTRQQQQDGSEYYGPYTSVGRVRSILDFLKGLYPLRTCHLLLNEKNIAAKKFRVCLEFHIGNCKGPCEGLQSEADYLQQIREIRFILKGNLRSVIGRIREEMEVQALAMHYEEAESLKKKAESLEAYEVKSTVVNPKINDVDVFAFVADEKDMFVGYLKVMNGTITMAQTVELKKRLEEDDEELLQFAIHELRSRFDSHSPEILLQQPIETALEAVEVTVPQIGDKKKLLDLALKNALVFRQSRRLTEHGMKEDPGLRVMQQLQQDFHLKDLPRHIECFDNSNFQGAYPVSSLVVFKNGKPSKKDYRHFNVKTVEGPDDFATMEEVVYRRYKRQLEENQPLPQLIIIDGGKGQLSAALQSLDKLQLSGRIAIAGIAKRLEEIYFPGDSLPLYINKKSESLRLIQQLRDEAHRFGITFHRKKRDQGTLKTELDEIKGIGEETSRLLLQHFRSVEKIKQATPEELSPVVGPSRAGKVFAHFHPAPSDSPEKENG